MFQAPRLYHPVAGTGRRTALNFYDLRDNLETSVYCSPDATGHGLGTTLYTALFAALEGEDVHRAYAGITMPNDASVALHEGFGFKQVAYFTEQGRKFGRYWDVAWFERQLGA